MKRMRLFWQYVLFMMRHVKHVAVFVAMFLGGGFVFTHEPHQVFTVAYIVTSGLFLGCSALVFVGTKMKSVEEHNDSIVLAVFGAIGATCSVILGCFLMHHNGNGGFLLLLIYVGASKLLLEWGLSMMEPISAPSQMASDFEPEPDQYYDQTQDEPPAEIMSFDHTGELEPTPAS